MWFVMLWGGFLGSIFLHECGHGLGARLQGAHVSTGFNQVGNAHRVPGDPGFRITAPGGPWTGLMGPVTSWVLALGFTFWLLRAREASSGALMLAALAIGGGLVRGLPVTQFLIPAAFGPLHVEDEVGTGIWCFSRFAHPELAGESIRALAQTHGAALRGSFWFWLPALVSLGISLTCLIAGYRKANALFGPRLSGGAARWAFRLMPLAAYAAARPVLDALDRAVRINW
jgi:hypothetical protein